MREPPPEDGLTQLDYREGYEVYPAASSDGIPNHLLRSHTTAILVRPGSSVVELGVRCWNQAWDITRRLETRLIRFPTLATSQPETVENLIARLFEPDFEHSLEITEPVSVHFTDHRYELIGDET